MRKLFSKLIVIVFAVLFIPALTVAQTQGIAGTYALYKQGDKSGKIVGQMRISGQHGNNFSVGIASPTSDPTMDWEGEGAVDGNRGYYTWRFKDGKTGRTNFSIDRAGNLYGQVRGSGINWDYVARKQ